MLKPSTTPLFLRCATYLNLYETPAESRSTLSLPINKNFSAFGKLGFFSSRAKASVSAGTLSAAATDNSTNISYGLGLGYTLNQSLGLRAEWERVDGKGSDNVDLLSAGVSYKFK